MHHFFDASWNRFLGGCWWILDAKMEASWHQNGIKNRFLRKHEKTHLELARECQLGFRSSKLGAKSIKIKNGVQDGMHLGIDF